MGLFKNDFIMYLQFKYSLIIKLDNFTNLKIACTEPLKIR